MSLEQGNLSETFGNPLAGRLPRRTAPPAPDVPQPQVSAAVVAPPAPAPVVPPAVPAQPKVQEAPSTSDPATNQVSVYVDSAVVKAIKAQRRGRTNARIAFDAIDATHDQLPALLAAKQAPAPGSLFAPQSADQDANPRVLWTFKATVANIKVIDELAARSGAASRSQLVAVALESYLLHR